MKKIEIGSEFDISDSIKSTDDSLNIYEYLKDFNTVYFDSGRSALRHLLTGVYVKNVLLPDYICESVRKCFDNCSVSYYKVDRKMLIDWDSLFNKLPETDLLYLHYFNGFIADGFPFDRLLKLKEKYGFLIVEDTTHSLFSAVRTVGDYCVCSLRKWFPVPDGGVLYSKLSLTESDYGYNSWYDEKYRSMELKGRYLSGANINKESFLSNFRRYEEQLDGQTEIYAISGASERILQSYDIGAIIDSRKKNCSYLQSKLKESFFKKVAVGGENQVPLFLTLSIENRDTVRNKLIQAGIYPPVHWPLYDELFEFPDACYNNQHELSIPIDQRYGEDEMQLVAQMLNSIMEDLENDRVD